MKVTPTHDEALIIVGISRGVGTARNRERRVQELLKLPVQHLTDAQLAACLAERLRQARTEIGG